MKHYLILMMQQDLLEAVASQRAKELVREQRGTKAEIEAQPALNRVVIHLTKGGAPSGVEFIESQASLNHPAVDKEYLRFLRDDLYLGIVIPRLPLQLEDDLIVRLEALREHARDEGYASSRGPVVCVYDQEGKINKRTISLLE